LRPTFSNEAAQRAAQGFDEGSVMLQVAQVYYDLLCHYWDNLTPTEYGYLLIAIFFGGYLLLKSNIK
jgi:hypothetical protein